MRDIIIEKLKEIEEKENIKILHCIESGSRAWGFASPDSDYDVRFIYVRPIEYYLRLDDPRDVIEWQLDDTLDINGWDIQKMFRLLYKSNPTVFEWNASSIVYKTTKEWENISKIINDYFVTKSGLYHYLSMAKNNYRQYLNTDQVRYKKYFYVLRPVLACKWILSNGTPPPMLFQELMETTLDKNIKPYVDKLLDIKMNSPEIETGYKIDVINNYLNDNIKEIDEIINTLPYDKNDNWDLLNKLFLELF